MTAKKKEEPESTPVPSSEPISSPPRFTISEFPFPAGDSKVFRELEEVGKSPGIYENMMKAVKEAAMQGQKVRVTLDLTFDEAIDVIVYLRKLRGSGGE